MRGAQKQVSDQFKRIDPAKDVEVAAVAPCPILVCTGQYSEIVADDLSTIAMCYGIDIIRAAECLLKYRGVALHRLPTVLRSARDAEPADGVFWSTEYIEKALEYGGHAKALLVYDPRRLKPAWVILDAECSALQRSEFKRLYPTVVWEKENETKLSRLPASAYHGGIGYDHYAYWIDGDPFDALVLIITVGPPGYPLASEVRQMVSECSQPEWKAGTATEQATVLKLATDTTRLKLSD